MCITLNCQYASHSESVTPLRQDASKYGVHNETREARAMPAGHLILKWVQVAPLGLVIPKGTIIVSLQEMQNPFRRFFRGHFVISVSKAWNLPRVHGECINLGFNVRCEYQSITNHEFEKLCLHHLQTKLFEI
jgi:hypothetical protein